MSATDAIKRYNFRNSFDTNEKGVTVARDFTVEDLDKARAEGFEEGRTAGIAEERASIEQAGTSCLKQIGDGLAQLAMDTTALKAGVEADALDTVLTIARKLVPHYAKTHALDEMEGVIRECLANVYDEPRIVVRAEESVLDHIKSRLDDMITAAGFSGKVVLFGDRTLAPGDCRVEWADGGTERDVERLWQDVDDTISRFLGREPDADCGDPAATDNDGQQFVGEKNG